MGDGNMTTCKIMRCVYFFFNQFDFFFLSFVSDDIPSMGQTTVVKQNYIVKLKILTFTSYKSHNYKWPLCHNLKYSMNWEQLQW